MRHFSFAMIALLLSPLGAAPLAAAPESDAECQITIGGDRIDGPCLFTPREGGSFDVRMKDGRKIDGADSLSLDIFAKGSGTLRDNTGRDWGAASRQADAACWAVGEISLCVRKPGEAPAGDAQTNADAGAGASAADPLPPAPQPVAEPSEADRARSFGARCHMGGCEWFIQGPVTDTGTGSEAVEGRRIAVTERFASAGYPGDYPEHAQAGLDWQEGTLELFCSTTRPAFRTEDGSWMVLHLPEVFGYTEGISRRYLGGCHPDVPNDPYSEFEKLGYKTPEKGPDTYPDFAALIAP